ncbi:MAG TPA: PAS domain S-box protein [Chryseolinea sp.]|nr:PAS domain S-box protein [Chryseolinea sp.]
MIPKKRAVKKRPQKKSKSKTVVKPLKNSPEKASDRQHHIDMALEAAQVGIWEWFIKTDKVRWSKIVYQIFGVTKKDFKVDITSYRTLVHPDDQENLAFAIQQTMANKKIYYVQHRAIWPDGTIKWIEASGNGIWNKQGEMIKLTGTAQDITERKKAENHFLESEQSYKTLFNSVEEAIYIQDRDGIFMDVNDGACKMYGYNRSELIGRTPAFLSAEGKNDFNLVGDKIKMALSGTPQTLEFWARRKNGEEFLKEVRVTKGFYFGEEILISTARDITERKNIEEELRESEQRFRTLQQASFGGIGIHDKGKIMDCNQGLSDITGYSRDELIGSDGMRLVAQEWREHAMEKILSGAEKPYDVEGVRKDGSRYSLEVQAKNIPYQGKMIRVTEFRDITERKINEAKIMEQNSRLLSVAEDLKRKNEQLEEFTQIVSHNLRSPVGNILTLINFFETSEKAEEKAEYLSLLKESGNTTQQTLNELNEVLKIKQNKKIPRQELHFDRVLQQVKSMLSAKITEVSATIESDFSQAPSILYPNIYLESIFLNLLSNSLKYVDSDRKPEIVFKTFQSNSNIILEARDNGLGINLERYGHQVFKLHKTFHKHPESRGIGLFMIKNQIEALGGEISIVSQVDKGTTIFVNFTKYNFDAAEDSDNSAGG